MLALARFPNVAIKISGACTLSRVGYPFDDIWPSLLAIIEAYGIERCLWGTDWTRAVEVVTLEDSVNAFKTTPRLSDADRSALLGESLAAIYGWRPS